MKSLLREQRALKRRPSSPDAERLDDLPERASGETPLSESFDVLWSRQILAQTVERVRGECRSKDRRALISVLEARVLDPIFNDAPLLPYEELVARFGLRSPSEASNLLITAKRMFARVLREVVRETVADEGDVEAGIQELKRILSKQDEIFLTRRRGDAEGEQACLILGSSGLGVKKGETLNASALSLLFDNLNAFE